MSNTILGSLFALNCALVIYLSINEKMHAQPWRLFALAFISILVVFWFQASINTLSIIFEKIYPGNAKFEDIKQILALINIVVGAFAGALIGTSVTNRAMHLNSKRLKELNVKRTLLKDKREIAEAIRDELKNQKNSFTREEFLQKHELRAQLLAEYIDEIHAIEDEEARLSL